MKYFTYIFRNARRNPVRSLLTIASTGICLALMMILLSFFAISDEANSSTRIYNRIAALNANGFAGMIPIARVSEIAELDGVLVVDGVRAVTPFTWVGGKYKDRPMPFAQFAIDPKTVFTVMSEFTVPPEELKAFQENMDGCAIGRKLANEEKLSVGDTLPIARATYPVDLNLTIRAIYDGPSNRDLRMCLLRWDYFDELRFSAPAARCGRPALAFRGMRAWSSSGANRPTRWRRFASKSTTCTATVSFPLARRRRRRSGRCSRRCWAT
jgi:putative ABC transport system permease protein